MNLVNLLKGLFNKRRRIDVKYLPSQGLFYNDDFEVHIKKADVEDILEYEHEYTKDDLSSIINRLKRVVEKNSFYSNSYQFSDLKSIDIVFLFLEIVKYTKDKDIKLVYFDDENGKELTIDFNSNNFNYYKLTEEMISKYDKNNKQFVIDEFKYSLPSIGVENCITNYLIAMVNESDISKYNDYSYDFIFFLGNKRTISFDEIDNLIQIFNSDLEEEDRKKVKSIVKMFQPMQKYSLIKDDRIIEINSKIDLEKIWKN